VETIKAAEIASPDFDRLSLLVSFQGCWSDAAVVQACSDRALARCAGESYGAIVGHRYLIAAMVFPLPDDLRVDLANVLAGNRAERWERCLAQERAGFGPAPESQDKLVHQLSVDRFARATCNMIFGTMDIATMMGAIIYDRVAP
jgi:hypothetical protein